MRGVLQYNNGYVCDDLFSQNSAIMACRDMGIYNGHASYESIEIGEDFTYFTLDDVSCDEFALTLEDCEYSDVNNCSPYEGVYLECGKRHYFRKHTHFCNFSP